jgi:hypothetical protein
MPWTDAAQTRVDILAALGLPMTAPRWIEHLQRAMDRVETYNGQPGIDAIEDYATKYQTAEAALNGNASEQGIKILGIGSGIEYFPGQRNAGFTSEMSRYRNLLLDALFWEGEKAEIRRMSSSFGRSTVRISR